jgi:hypothetical protein
MSFVHESIVGHFDPFDVESLSPSRPVPLRPLDVDLARRLLTSFGDAVAQCVSFEGGYARCKWSNGPSELIREYAERLADQEGAMILETPGWVRYPAGAASRFEEAVKAWQKSRDRA